MNDVINLLNKVLTRENEKYYKIGASSPAGSSREYIKDKRDKADDYIQELRNAIKAIEVCYSVKEEWNKYKQYLQEKYPTKDGEEWCFTCSHHEIIDAWV